MSNKGLSHRFRTTINTSCLGTVVLRIRLKKTTNCLRTNLCHAHSDNRNIINSFRNTIVTTIQGVLKLDQAGGGVLADRSSISLDQTLALIAMGMAMAVLVLTWGDVLVDGWPSRLNLLLLGLHRVFPCPLPGRLDRGLLVLLP